MSTTVDQRVVKMEFDNKQFESNIKSSISSLDQLKQSLDFKNLGSSLANLSESVSKIEKRFSNLGVVGMAALTNISNKAMAVGSKIVKSLTITPIISGFQEYETQINATQTILSNTSKEGATIKDVNAALDELNKYADMTIYNFTEMTKNIGTFTAAGVDLNTSVNAIQGIANLAAVSGSTSQQASTAMYQLSQALSSGTVQLQDWNSVVNAGMGGQKFQDALKMTAKVHGINVDKMIKKHGSFRETLSKEKWITKDILTETLQHFTAFTDEYNEKTLKAQGYTEKQIAEIKAMGIDATEAATKVKTFTQLWDVVQEATQSGWSQSWRLIIGDFEQAKLTMTEFSDEVTAVINSISDRRNALLTAGLTTGINQFVTKAGVDFETYSDSLYEVAKNHGVAIDDMIEEDGSFEATLQRGWLTSDMLKESINNTSESIGKMTKKQLKAAGYTEEQAEAIAKFNEEVQNGTEDVDSWVKVMGRASGRENLMESLLNIFKAVLAIAKPVREAFENVFPPMTGEQLYTITERIREFTEKLIISENTADKVRGVIEGVLTIVKPFVTIIKNAIKLLATLVGAVIPPLLSVLMTVSGYIGAITSKVGKLIDVNKLMDLETQIITKVIKNISSYILALGDVIGYLIEKLTGVDVGNFEQIEGILDKVFGKLTKFRDAVIDVADAVAEGDAGANDTAATLKGKLDNALATVSEKYKTFSADTKEAIDAIVSFGKKVAKFFAPAVEVIKNSFKGTSFADFLSAGLLTGIFLQLKKFSKEMKTVKESFVDVLGSAKDALEQYQKTLKAKTLVSIAIAVGILAASLLVLSHINPDNLTSSLIAMSVVLAEVMITLKIILSEKFEFGTDEAKKVAMAAGVMILISTAFLIMAKAMAELSVFQSWDTTWPALVTMIALMGGLTGAAIALSKFGANTDIIKSSIAMVLMATAVKQLAKSLTAFAEMDVEKTKKGLTILAILLTEIVAFTKFAQMAGMENARNTLVGLAVAMIGLGYAIKLFGSIEPDVLTQGMTVLAALLFGLTVSLKALAQVNISGAASTIIALAIAMGLLMIPILAFGHMDLVTLAKGLGTVCTAIVVMSVSLGLLKSLSGGLGGAAKSILAMAVAMTALVIPIAILGSMSLTQLALGIGSLTLGMIALAATSVIIYQAAYAMNALGKALIMIGIGSLGIALAIGGITLAITTLATMGAVGVAAVLASFAAFLAGLIAMAPLIEQALVTMINTLLNVIQRTGPTLIETVITLIDALLASIAAHADSILRSIINIITSILKAVVGLIKEYGPILWEKAKGLMGKLVKGIGAGVSSLWEKVKEVGAKIPEGIKEGIGDILKVGADVVSGFIEGITGGMSNVISSALDMGKTFLSNLKTKLGIASPSKEAKKIAAFVIEGFTLGIDQNLGDVKESADNLAATLTDTLESELANLFNEMTFGRKATALFMREFGDISNVDAAKKSFEQASTAVKNYAKQLYLASDAYEENKQAVKDLEKEQASLEKQITKLSKKTDDESKDSLKTAKENLKETKKELKKAKKEITEGTKEFVKNMKTAYNDLQTSIAESLESTMDPLSMSLDTQIDMFKKFEADTDEITVTTLLENMKSQVEGITSWNDRLEALADKGFAASILEELKNLGPTATNYIKVFEDMTTEQMDQANTYFKQSAQLTVDTFLSNWQDSKDAVTKWSDNLVELSKKGVEQGFLEAIAQAGMSTEELVNALMNATDEQLTQLNTMYNDALVDEHAAQAIMMALSAAGAGMSTELANALTAQISPESEAGTALTTAATTTGTKAADAAATGLVTGTTSNANTTKVTEAAEQLGTATVNGVSSKVNVSSGKKMGKNLCSGLVKGLKEGKASVIEAAKEVAQDAVDSANDTLGIKSPSKVFMKIGRFVDLGFAKGLRKYSGKVEDATGEVGNSSLKGVKKALANIAKVVDSDMDTTPVIRPVIDLDNVQQGINSMNGMFSDQVIDVNSIRAKTASISSGMSGGSSTSVSTADGKLQNGNTFSFVQNNYSPKALSQIDIYRQTKNQFSAMKGALGGV
jgi:tape measure domain-containing protein